MVTFRPSSRTRRIAWEVTSPSPSASMAAVRTVYAIHVVCTPGSAGSIRLSSKACSWITFFIRSHRLSVSTGYQPVTYAPSYGPDLPPVASSTVWSTLPRTVPVRTPG